jgi:hypothetical protein
MSVRVITHLPAEATARFGYPDVFRDHLPLEFQILIQGLLLFLDLANIVRRGGYYKLGTGVRNLPEQWQTIAQEKRHIIILGIARADLQSSRHALSPVVEGNFGNWNGIWSSLC